jgi:hypothetical protein
MERHEAIVLGKPHFWVRIKDRHTLLEARAVAWPLQEKMEPPCVVEQVLERVLSGFHMRWSKQTMGIPVSQGKQEWACH